MKNCTNYTYHNEWFRKVGFKLLFNEQEGNCALQTYFNIDIYIYIIIKKKTEQGYYGDTKFSSSVLIPNFPKVLFDTVTAIHGN